MENEEEDRIEDVTGKQNKNKIEKLSIMYYVTCSKVKRRAWNQLTGIPQRMKVC